MTGHKGYNEGFTLLEAIISIAILLVAVTSASGLILGSMQGLHVTKNRVAAAYLAQEGIEVVRNIRDTSWIEGVSYSNKLGETGSSDDPYCIDYDSTTLISPPCDYRLYINSQGRYTHSSSGATPTTFERRIVIKYLDNPEDDPDVNPDPPVLQVLSIVNWIDANGGSITVEDRLYDWK